MRDRIRNQTRKIRGSILVISVIMLGVIGGLSISALSDIAVEQRIVRNDKDQLLAKRAAAFAVSRARQLLLSNWSVDGTKCTGSGCVCADGVCVFDRISEFSAIDFTQQNSLWWGGYGTSVTNPSATGRETSRYLIIDLGCDDVSTSRVYRIIGRGTGSSSEAVAFADTYFRIELSGQNTFSSGTTVVVTGTSTAGDTSTLDLAPLSQRSDSFFHHNNAGAGAVCAGTGQTGNTGASCEMNCEGEVRVKGYSSYEGCDWKYGPWTKGSENQSSISLDRPETEEITHYKQVRRVPDCIGYYYQWTYNGCSSWYWNWTNYCYVQPATCWGNWHWHGCNLTGWRWEQECTNYLCWQCSGRCWPGSWCCWPYLAWCQSCTWHYRSYTYWWSYCSWVRHSYDCSYWVGCWYQQWYAYSCYVLYSYTYACYDTVIDYIETIVNQVTETVSCGRSTALPDPVVVTSPAQLVGDAPVSSGTAQVD